MFKNMSFSNKSTPLSNNNLKHQRYKELVTRAINERKVFTIIRGYPPLRRALRERGWLEKLAPDQHKDIQMLDSNKVLALAKDGNDYEVVALSNILNKSPSNFVWHPKHYKLGSVSHNPYRNHIKRAQPSDFTLKEGLANIEDSVHWHQVENFSETNCPRTYILDLPATKDAFVADFRLTACLNFVDFLSNHNRVEELFSGSSVTKGIIKFAREQIDTAIRYKQHDFINNNLTVPTLTGSLWAECLSQFQSIMNKRDAFEHATPEQIEECVEDIKAAAKAALSLRPQLRNDGNKNIWIVKPGNKCRGVGIVVYDNDKNVLDHVEKNRGKIYIVQKYLERPHLIYKTKFDIRQYFIFSVDMNQQIRIWMYKNCYLRFSSQEFSLEKLSESIHLTNHAVQKKYTNGKRDPRLPTQNMWSLFEFREYLKTIEHADVWEEKIYPGMKKNICAVIIASLDETEFDRNTFELYGVDFMIDENFEPVLIEINASPDLNPTTVVTQQICADVLEDTIKVIIDWSQNPTASTGDFECIYDIPLPRTEPYVYNMVVYGKRAGSWQPITQAKRQKTHNLAQQQRKPVQKEDPKIAKNKTPKNKTLPSSRAAEVLVNRFSKPSSMLQLAKPVGEKRSLPDFLKNADNPTNVTRVNEETGGE